ncbi:MAG TPA: hypothetical protein VGA21_00385 [Cyclobacteriaceae bacterium]
MNNIVNHYLIKLVLTCCFSILYISASLTFGQTWEEQPGEIEEAEVVIEKNIKIVLPFAARNFEKIPPQPVSIRPGALTYSFASFLPVIQPINPRLRVVTISDEEISKLYGGYLKAGFGNYTSPLLNAYIFTKRNEKFSLGAFGNYLSSFRGPVDKKNSASSDLNLGVTGSIHGEDVFLRSEIDYSRLGRYFYGYQDGLLVDRDTIQQIINRFNVRLNLSGELSTTPWLYNLGAGYRYIGDEYDATENEARISGGLGYKLDADGKIVLDAEYMNLGRSDNLIDGLNRNLLQIAPAYHFTYNKIQILAGINMTVENDTIKGLNKFHLYPDINATFNISGSLSLYGGINGKINVRSLDYWLQENPFLNENTPIFHSNQNLEVYGGLYGQLVNPLGFQLGASIASVKNMSYLVNDSQDISRFTLVYDSMKTSIANVFGQLSLQKEQARIWFRGDYWGYNTGAVQEAWHLPSFEITAGTKINIYEKIMVSGNFKSLFGIKAYDPVSQLSIDLDPVLKLDIEVEYLLSKIAGIFVQANNVISSPNEAYFRYPSRGFQVIGGLTFSF